MATTPDRREYYRQRYLRNRERILEKQKAYGKQPEVRERRLKYWHERYKVRIANSDDLKAKRRRQQLDSYYLRHYGTTTPEPGARSVIDGRRYLGPKELRPPKPCPATPSSTKSQSATSSKPTPPKKPTGPCSTASSRTTPKSTTARSTATTNSTPPTKTGTSSRNAWSSTTKPAPKPWIPTPVSRWEPGLDRQAEREFYL